MHRRTLQSAPWSSMKTRATQIRRHATNGRFHFLASEKKSNAREDSPMTCRYMAWLCGLLGALVPTGGLHAQESKVLNVALAGTMEHVISRQMGPAFTAATGYTLNVTRAPSIALASRIVSGELKPDVYISSDANVMELFMGPAHNARSR